jgi:hypothetical protein
VNRTSIHRLAPSSAPVRAGKIRLVLKRTSSPLNSQASAANALLPAVDARGHGSAAVNATQRWR